jgi:hypothetical protein
MILTWVGVRYDQTVGSTWEGGIGVSRRILTCRREILDNT